MWIVSQVLPDACFPWGHVDTGQRPCTRLSSLDHGVGTNVVDAAASPLVPMHSERTIGTTAQRSSTAAHAAVMDSL